MLQLNYYPNANARALAQQSSDTIGLLVDDISDPFFGFMVKTIDQVAVESGNFLLIANGYHDANREKLAIEHLIRQQCRAIVVHASRISDKDLAEFMQQIPGIVLINRHGLDFSDRCIVLDNQYGSWLAIRYLIQHKHQKIAWLGSNNPLADAIERQTGYLAALEEHQLPVSKDLMAFGEPTAVGGEKAMIALLNRRITFSAVFCYNDSMAAGALITLQDNGFQVPQDISLCGFDDILVSRYVRPALTTVRYPLQNMAQQAAMLALALVQGTVRPNVTHLFHPTFVIRHSVPQHLVPFDP
jgi:LacI family transcriptional regulator